jgi:hypothetical protein
VGGVRGGEGRQDFVVEDNEQMVAKNESGEAVAVEDGEAVVGSRAKGLFYF